MKGINNSALSFREKLSYIHNTNEYGGTLFKLWKVCRLIFFCGKYDLHLTGYKCKYMLENHKECLFSKRIKIIQVDHEVFDSEAKRLLPSKTPELVSSEGTAEENVEVHELSHRKSEGDEFSVGHAADLQRSSISNDESKASHNSSYIEKITSIDYFTINVEKALSIYKEYCTKFEDKEVRTIESHKWPVKDNGYEMSINTGFGVHEKIAICKRLNCGGTKEVFECEINREHFAIAIPNGFYHAPIKWKVALKEVDLSDKLRKENHPVLPFQKIIPIIIGDLTIPAIIMPLFSELEGVVIDHKNISVHIGELMVKKESTGLLIRFSDITDIECFIDVVQPLLKQAGELIHKKRFFENDAINFRSFEDGRFELFLFDLFSVSSRGREYKIGMDEAVDLYRQTITDNIVALCWYYTSEDYERMYIILKQETSKKRLLDELEKFALIAGEQES